MKLLSTTAKPRLEVGVKETVKEMLSGFATNRQPTSLVRPRAEATLHGDADRNVLQLNLVAHVDARPIPGAGGSRYVAAAA